MKAIIALFAASFASLAGAQPLSVSDITSQIDAGMAALDEYSALLNDPDPRRALKAI